MREIAWVLVLAAVAADAKPPAGGDACRMPPPRQLVEVFLSADCGSCWQQAAGEAPSVGTLRLDWIVPGKQGDESPLAVAAVPEASERLRGEPGSDAATVKRQALPVPPAGVGLSVESGLAWNGYLGLSLKLQRQGARALPADAAGWLALVERVPAGEDGSPVARQLVRTVIGPLPLAFAAGSHSLQHLRAVTLPANGRPERLAAVGWVARPDGKVILAAQSAAAGCDP